jgi:leucyl aminopeptidase
VEIRFLVDDPLGVSADAAVVPIVAANGDLVWEGLAARADEAFGGELRSLAKDARFRGNPGSTFVIPTLGRLPVRRLVLAGCGSLATLTSEAVRRAWGAATTAARDAGAVRIVSALPPDASHMSHAETLAAAVTGARLATYRFTKYFGAARNDEPPPRAVEDLLFVDRTLEASVASMAIDRGNAIADAVELARDLVNEPACTLTPAAFADRAREVAAGCHLDITVLGPEEMSQLGMGAIVAVGRGSANEPRLIHLVYRPDAAPASPRQIGIVGKAITFDSGGYSIKPYEGMLEMKGDMAGGAAVLGAMSALRALGCPHVVHGVIAAAENMISGEAFRPGDILTALNGVTIEVLSTDAEGRLVLADALVYTARQGAEELIDLATLTGAKVVALGEEMVALFSSDERLATDLLRAADVAGERLWRMPLAEELKDKIKGDIGDIKNTGGRAGGAITAALFLRHFTEGRPWAHLDIAGANLTSKAGPYTPKGATGVGVRTLLEYLLADSRTPENRGAEA